MTTDQMLAHTASLLRMGDQWHARAVGSSVFHAGATPQEAMQRALGLEPAAQPAVVGLFA